MNNVKNSVRNVLHMESTTMQFGGVVAVNGLILGVNGHEVMALIGPNNADRTTALNYVTGIYQSTFGSVSFSGEAILADTPRGKIRRLYGGDVSPVDLTLVHKAPDQITRLGTAGTFQSIRLFGALIVFENVLIAKHMWTGQDVFSAMLRLNHTEEKCIRQESMALPKMQGLAHLKNEVASSLPYRLQYRLETTRTLATSPSLLLLDEPATGMNPQETRDPTDFIHRIRDDYHLTIFIVEHHMDPVIQISDHIYMLDFDKLIAHSTPGQIQNSPKIIEAYLGVNEDAEGRRFKSELWRYRGCKGNQL